jgi:hypothetical protein
MRNRNRTTLLLSACRTLAPALAAQQSAATILGQWRGQSICVKAEWNASCNDEQVIYRFEPAAAGGRVVTMHAFKIVNGVEEPMGDLDFAPDSVPNQWSGEFSNARVHIRVSYIVTGDSLVGRMVDVPDGRPRRNMAAVRDSAAAP